MIREAIASLKTALLRYYSGFFLLQTTFSTGTSPVVDQFSSAAYTMNTANPMPADITVYPYSAAVTLPSYTLESSLAAADVPVDAYAGYDNSQVTAHAYQQPVSQTAPQTYPDATFGYEAGILFEKDSASKQGFSGLFTDHCATVTQEQAEKFGETTHYQGHFQNFPADTDPSSYYHHHSHQTGFHDNQKYFSKSHGYHQTQPLFSHSEVQGFTDLDQKQAVFSHGYHDNTGHYQTRDESGYPGYHQSGYYDSQRLPSPDANFNFPATGALYRGEMNIHLSRQAFQRRPSLTISTPRTPEGWVEKWKPCHGI